MAAVCSLLLLSLLKCRSKSLGQRRDVTRKFWTSVIPGVKVYRYISMVRLGMLGGVAINYTPGIYAEGYIAFVFPFVGSIFCCFPSHS